MGADENRCGDLIDQCVGSFDLGCHGLDEGRREMVERGPYRVVAAAERVVHRASRDAGRLGHGGEAEPARPSLRNVSLAAASAGVTVGAGRHAFAHISDICSMWSIVGICQSDET